MSTEAGLPADLPRPRRAKGPLPGVGIVHLGLGAFFRAHGALYVEEAMRASGGDWGVVGVSLQSPGQRDALKPQDCMYHAVEQGPQGEKARLVEIVQDVLVAKENPEAVISLLTRPAVKIVTLTITEKGYCHEPSTGRLNLQHPDIVRDIEGLLPVTAPGFIVRALQRRKLIRAAPFTVLTCDNLPSNGKVVRQVVLDLARRIDPELAQWIEAEGRFPSTMVDRIVPATKPEDIERVAALTGLHDASPVMHEPFRQFVIEDDFVGEERPDFEAAGAQLVRNVEPFEHMKLRMLNGAHSAIAYLGYLADKETIAEAVADAAFSGYVRGLWEREIIPTLLPPSGVDLNAYAAQLLDRFRNPAIRHRTWQIAMDGSQKLPQRILGTLAKNHADRRPSPGLILAIAAWVRYVSALDEKGRPIDVRDPLASRLRNMLAAAQTPREKAAAALTVSEVFDPSLAAAIRPELEAACDRLWRIGAREAVSSVI